MDMCIAQETSPSLLDAFGKESFLKIEAGGQFALYKKYVPWHLRSTASCLDRILNLMYRKDRLYFENPAQQFVSKLVDKRRERRGAPRPLAVSPLESICCNLEISDRVMTDDDSRSVEAINLRYLDGDILDLGEIDGNTAPFPWLIHTDKIKFTKFSG